ncbi:17646_t:CDS:2 [Cetraspora pellucida]|uniref:17646_t:CDS:1 n=1 Tax=Cetraspora pellucida TaxID=1433469 RepID=A0A9N9GT71_9GLOM|nr:17646_t:CDS:2 [Cetraspora pellucida]
MKQRDDRSDTSGASPKIKVERLSPRLETEQMSIVPEPRYVRDWLSSLYVENREHVQNQELNVIVTSQIFEPKKLFPPNDDNVIVKEEPIDKEFNQTSKRRTAVRKLDHSQIMDDKSQGQNKKVKEDGNNKNGEDEDIEYTEEMLQKVREFEILLEKFDQKALEAYNAYMDLNSILSPDMEIIIDLPKHINRNAIHQLMGFAKNGPSNDKQHSL